VPLWLDEGDDVNVARHEGGHVIVGWYLHLNPVRVSIDGGDGYGGKTCFSRALSGMSDRDLAFAGVVARLAGVEAEKMFGDPDDGGKNDLAQARARKLDLAI
jgi:hypothetical protein